MTERSSGLWWRLVRFGLRLLYNEFAFTYDTVSRTVSLGAWRCWQRSALNSLDAPAGARVLEIAYGTGDLQLDLNAAGYRAFGHDLSPQMARIASGKLQRAHLPIRLSRGPAQKLPYGDATFAAVVSTFPAEFILAPETLREVHRVLVDDGRFVIVPNGVLTSQSAAAAGIEWLYRVTGQRGGEESSDAIARHFRPYGFEVEVRQEPCPRSLATVLIARKFALANQTAS